VHQLEIKVLSKSYLHSSC